MKRHRLEVKEDVGRKETEEKTQVAIGEKEGKVV